MEAIHGPCLCDEEILQLQNICLELLGAWQERRSEREGIFDRKNSSKRLHRSESAA